MGTSTKAALVSVCCAVALATAGCSGGSAAAPDAADVRPTASETGPAGSDGSGNVPQTSVPGPTPTVTTPNLTGLGDDVTPEELEFVERNTPPGVDAVAVLIAGNDTCTRLETAAASGEDSLVAALVDGQVPSAADAVTYLCPELQPVMDRAEEGFADGSYAVGERLVEGEQVLAGSYEALTPTSSCSWTVRDPAGAVVDSGQGTDDVTVDLEASTTFTSTGCVAWVRV